MKVCRVTCKAQSAGQICERIGPSGPVTKKHFLALKFPQGISPSPWIASSPDYEVILVVGLRISCLDLWETVPWVCPALFPPTTKRIRCICTANSIRFLSCAVPGALARGRGKPGGESLSSGCRVSDQKEEKVQGWKVETANNVRVLSAT